MALPHLHIFFSNVSHVQRPPWQDLDRLYRSGRQQVSSRFTEEAKPAAGTGLVHEVDVLIAADAE